MIPTLKIIAKTNSLVSCNIRRTYTDTSAYGTAVFIYYI